MDTTTQSFLNRSRRCAVGLLLGGMVLTLGSSAVLADPARAPAAAPAAKAVKKFATDEVLRQGMTKIAALLDKSWKDIQDGQLKGPAYVELAGQVEGEVANIVKNCKLDEHADHAFHEILSDLNQSAGLMRRTKPEIQRTGGLALAQALRNYAKYFDHPGWTGLR